MLFSPGKADAPNEPISGRTRLVKMLFLFKQEVLPHFKAGTEITENNFYEFFPWNFGPFSTQVYDDLSFFQLRGFIDASPSTEEALPEAAAEWDEWQGQTKVDDDVEVYEEESFTLTKSGLGFACELSNLLSPTQRQTLKAFKGRFALAPLRSILRYVYQTYPQFTIRSTIKEEVLGDGR